MFVGQDPILTMMPACRLSDGSQGRQAVRHWRAGTLHFDFCNKQNVPERNNKGNSLLVLIAN